VIETDKELSGRTVGQMLEALLAKGSQAKYLLDFLMKINNYKRKIKLCGLLINGG
jgi:hypothetical protein